MQEYPVYYQGKEICKWNPLKQELWNHIEDKLSRKYEFRNDYLCYLEKNSVHIMLKMTGEGG